MTRKMKFTITILMILGTAISGFPQKRQGTGIGSIIGSIGGKDPAIKSGRIVKDAPFRADVKIENLRILGDGNKIAKTKSLRIAREKSGRFMKEEGDFSNGIFAVNEKNLYDVIGEKEYIMNVEKKTFVTVDDIMNVYPSYDSEFTEISCLMMVPGGGILKKESLGTKIIEGVSAEGRLTTVTIPANHVGNEKEVNIRYERWYSPKLKILTSSDCINPWNENEKMRVTNIKTEETVALMNTLKDYKSKKVVFVPASNNDFTSLLTDLFMPYGKEDW